MGEMFRRMMDAIGAADSEAQRNNYPRPNAIHLGCHELVELLADTEAAARNYRTREAETFAGLRVYRVSEDHHFAVCYSPEAAVRAAVAEKIANTFGIGQRHANQILDVLADTPSAPAT